MVLPELNVWDTLPLHPQPEYREALSSYLGRLMAANKIDSQKEMLSLCFPERHWRHVVDRLDHGELPLTTLAALTCRPETILQTTTCAPLQARFESKPRDNPPTSFLHLGLTPTRQFCPWCIVHHPWYNLVWHFEFVRGCIYHNCWLIDRCYRCHTCFPLLSSFHEPGICSKCGFDHREQVTAPLSMEGSKKLTRYVRDLEYLLMPLDENEPELNTTMRDIGIRLATRRRAVGLTRDDISPFVSGSITSRLDNKAEVEDDMRVIHELCTFFDYTYFLGLTVRDLFEPTDQTIVGEILQGSEDLNTVMNRALANINNELHSVDDRRQRWKGSTEAALLQTVAHAIQVLREKKQIPTIPLICEIAEIPEEIRSSKEKARHYMMVAMGELRRRNRYKERAQLVMEIVAAIDSLRTKNMTISPSSVAQYLNRRPQDLLYFPETVSILHAVTSIRFPNQDIQH